MIAGMIPPNTPQDPTRPKRRAGERPIRYADRELRA